MSAETKRSQGRREALKPLSAIRNRRSENEVLQVWARGKRSREVSGDGLVEGDLEILLRLLLQQQSLEEGLS